MGGRSVFWMTLFALRIDIWKNAGFRPRGTAGRVSFVPTPTAEPLSSNRRRQSTRTGLLWGFARRFRCDKEI
jgi:hypothetical protein